MQALCALLGVPPSMLTTARPAWVMNRFLSQCFPGKRSSARSAKARAVLAKSTIWSEALFAQVAATMQQAPDPVRIRQAFGEALLLQALDAEVGVVLSLRRVPARPCAGVELRMRGIRLRGEELRQHHQEQESFNLQQLASDDMREFRESLRGLTGTAGVSPAP
jgi:hypothetical protein